MNPDMQHEDGAADGASQNENPTPIEAESPIEAEAWGEEFSPEELAELFGGEENVPAAPMPRAQVLEDAEDEEDEEEDPEAGTGDRLQKLLARSGVASRRAAEDLIRTGRVTVNGVVVTELGRRARAEKDVITVDGRVLRLAGTGSTVVVLYKPRGCVATKSDPQGRTTVMEFLPRKLSHLHPVGRLDFDTSGLLLLTDDGGLTHLLLHPSHGVEKRYHARVRGQVSTATIDRLQKGVTLDDGVTAPCRVRVKAQTPSNALLEIVLREGRNRQVRRMLQAVGHPVSALRRVRLGPIDLGGLVSGGYRELLPGEVHLLKKAANATKPALKSARPFAYKPRPSKAADKSAPQGFGSRGARPEARTERPENRPERPYNRTERPENRPERQPERRPAPPTPAREGNSRPYAARDVPARDGAPRSSGARPNTQRSGPARPYAPRDEARPQRPSERSSEQPGQRPAPRTFGGRSEPVSENRGASRGPSQNAGGRPANRPYTRPDSRPDARQDSRPAYRGDERSRPRDDAGPRSAPRAAPAGNRPPSPGAGRGPSGNGAANSRPQPPQKRGGSKLAKRIEDRWK